MFWRGIHYIYYSAFYLFFTFRVATQYPSSLRPSMVRLGHPARISPIIQSFCLEALAEQHEGAEVVMDIRTEMNNIHRHLNKIKDKNEKRIKRGELRSLQKEIRVREELVIKNILNITNIIFCTCAGNHCIVL